MAILTEKNRAGEFLLSEVDPTFREAITLIAGQNLKAGAILGRIETGAASSSADGGNTGDGTLSAVSLVEGIQAGDYVLTVTTSAVDGGEFQVTDPQGDVIGIGAVGAAFTGGGLSFTLSDGTIDFVVGDRFIITVAEGSLKYTQLNPAGIDGSQYAAAILYDDVDASLADSEAIAIERLAVANDSLLVWPAGISADEKAGAIGHLKSNHLMIR
ncbi:head decoration protein [Methylomarinum sp. Ch1-1]|uniref:Head decoration protein n=1 Tax=Methylomarinum roseum TaxID=3067653 RepID=A0AAU7NSX6_9GAMM|nr:head decoration protein [Methylomarinum sp. Ch1-1]MDP4519918.1 head decoration protein [Methylomarinum sp. Ch1-1]